MSSKRHVCLVCVRDIIFEQLCNLRIKTGGTKFSSRDRISQEASVFKPHMADPITILCSFFLPYRLKMEVL